MAPAITSRPTQIPGKDLRTQYTLDVVFDYNEHTLAVDETIRYVNNTPEALADLVLMVEPNRWEGGFSLLSIQWNGEAILQYELLDDTLNIPLPKPLPSGEIVVLQISYTLDLPQIPEPTSTSRPVPYGYTERQTNIVDWYPYIPPYRSGEGWLVNPHWGFGENLVFDSVDFKVRLTLSEPVQDLVIAASAPVKQEGSTMIYSLEEVRTFALSASDEYQVQTLTVDNIDIYSYSFPYDKYSGQEVLQNTADALQLYSQLISPYPHSTLSVVEADFLDGMEYDGLFFLSHGFYDLYDGTPKGYLTFIAAHETAHQWWYGLVGNDQAIEPWLDEALCTYMEHIFYETVYANYRTSSGQSMVDWWWYYRINYYQPGGWVDGAIYNYSSFRSYRDAVYLNGAKFLEDLRNLIGDKAFFAFLRDYARQEAGQIATASDFFAILQGHTNADLGELLSEYFQSDS
jgi:hypothetical protein